MLNRKDARGLPMSGCDTVAAAHYETALWRFQCSVGDPLTAVDLALRERPDFVMAHVLRAYLNLCGTEKAGLPAARQALARAMTLGQTERESAHIAAATALADGHWDTARGRLQRILDEHPRDVLALQVAHLFDFYCGDARNLRDRPARVRPEWRHDMPGYSAVLAMHAFGLEENSDFSHAEDTGRAAIEIEPRDCWAHHAVAHVMEMQGRRRDGIAWMRAREKHWAEDSFFSVHNWWHLALYHLDLEETQPVLAIYDQKIRGGRSSVALDMIDASAMLWRLSLRGVEVGDRWQEIAEAWAPFVEDGFYAFNDVHAMMAMIGAGRWREADRILAAMRKAQDGTVSNGVMTREVGLPLARALHAFGRGAYEAALDGLSSVRPIAQRFGGSNAQRDIVDLTLLEAARRAGKHCLVRAMANERLALKPNNVLALRYRADAGTHLAA
ncbi:MAG: tetratricopeptide repeat protein [Reyranellaceae bacterium]